MLDIPSYELSYVLNHHLNVTFNDFVNYFRIQKAIEMMSVPEVERQKFDVIAEKCGFSWSSFNSAFKKIQVLPQKIF